MVGRDNINSHILTELVIAQGKLRPENSFRSMSLGQVETDIKFY